jgi:phenylacetate-CoA ligase
LLLEYCGGLARVNVEADPGVTGFMVEKALKEALGVSPRGDVYPIGGLPRTEGKAQRVFYRKSMRELY